MTWIPSGVSSFGRTIKSSSDGKSVAEGWEPLTDCVTEGWEPPTEGPLTVGEEICVEEKMGELVEAGEAESDKGEGRSSRPGAGAFEGVD